MKVKLLEFLDIDQKIFNNDPSHYGLTVGGTYEVVECDKKFGSYIVLNNNGKKVMLYEGEVEVYEEE